MTEEQEGVALTVLVGLSDCEGVPLPVRDGDQVWELVSDRLGVGL